MKKHKAFILAAGQGTRLSKYTENLPKAMLHFGGMTLLQRQILTLRQAGIMDIHVIKGFEQEKIVYPGINYYVNKNYANTNMVASLFCAEEELEGDIIVTYGDIIYETPLLEKMVNCDADIAVAVDSNWDDYWRMRYGTINFDTESLKTDNGRIVELGRENPPAEDMEKRYIGIIKFSSEGVKALKEVWNKYKDEYKEKPWKLSGKSIMKAYMTDMLQALIDEGYDVKAVEHVNGWLEFDTNEDYEKALGWLESNKINKLIDIGL